MDKILIVEDDENIARLIQYNLSQEGFLADICENGAKVSSFLKQSKYNLILLDLMLPDKDGLTICKSLRSDAKTSSIPIIMVTAKGQEIDRIMGFEYGADDYVVKPFSTKELILRIKALLKRSQKGKVNDKKQGVLKSGVIKMDLDEHKVYVNQKEVDFTMMEFNLLKVLMERKGRVQRREQLLEDVWDISADVTSRTVDTHIKRLRKKLGEYENLIETVRGVGYRFETSL